MDKEIIKTHNIVLLTDNIKLRPMTDSDLDILLKWNSNAEVLYFSDSDEVESYSLDDIKNIYGHVSKTAFCFIIEYNGLPIGECWLQKMNLDYILNKYPKSDLRRVDITIGEKTFWNKGIGTRVIKRLIEFGFTDEKADMLFYMPIDHNIRSIKAAEKAGFELIEKIPTESTKGNYEYIMAIKKSICN